MSFKIKLIIGEEISFNVKSNFYVKDSNEFLAAQRKILQSINENLFSSENKLTSDVLNELANKYLQCYENRLKNEVDCNAYNLKLINFTRNQLAKKFEIFI